MAKKRRRDCTKCIAYGNMLYSRGDCCGLGFEVMEDLEESRGGWKVIVHPVEDKCESIKLPKSKEEFVKTAGSLGIQWDIEDVICAEDYEKYGW